MSSFRTPELTSIMEIITDFFDVTILFLPLVIFTAALVYKLLGKRTAVFFVSTLFVGGVLVFATKYFFNVARPLDSLVTAIGPSFPSFHSATATVYFLLLMHYFDNFMKGGIRKLFNFACLTLLFLVAFSRIYLGVHWLSDVLGGIFLGVLVTYIANRFFEHRKNTLTRTSMVK